MMISKKQPEQIPTVLIVDDEPVVRILITRLLQRIVQNCRIETAADGLEAAEKLLTLEPELAIVDVGLPHLNGLDLSQLIRTQPVHAKTRVLLVTGKHAQEVEHICFQEGAYEFLSKPFHPDQFAESIGRLL
jgi:CheY-like chemotaxis protein